MFANIPPMSDDIVVMAPISLNARRAKKNMKKIAERASSRETAPFEPRAPEKRERQRPSPQQKRERPRRQQRTEQSTQSVPVACVEQRGAGKALCSLSSDTFALLLTFAGLPVVSSLAQTCTAARSTVDSGEFWRSLIGVIVGPRNVLSTHLMQSLMVDPRGGLRRWTFGLEGDWLRSFKAHALSHPNVLEVLQQGEYMCGGLIRADARLAADFAACFMGAADQCQEELDEARRVVRRTLRKVEARREIFGMRTVRQLRECELDVAERAMLTRLALQDDEPTFDYFGGFEEEVKGELDPDVSMDLAQSFLAVMERRHAD